MLSVVKDNQNTEKNEVLFHYNFVIWILVFVCAVNVLCHVNSESAAAIIYHRIFESSGSCSI